MVYSFSLQCVATVYNIDRGGPLSLSVSTAVFVSNVWFLLWRREWLPQHACMQALSAMLFPVVITTVIVHLHLAMSTINSRIIIQLLV